MADSSRESRQMARLSTELSDDGIDLIEACVRWDGPDSQVPNGWLNGADIDALEQRILEELSHARHVSVHEGRRPSYGAIICPDSEVSADFDNLMYPVVDATMGSLRELANGTSTFVVRAELEEGLIYLDSTDELALMNFCVEQQCWIVQRHSTGTIKVFERERLLLWENNTWSRRPYAHTRWMQLSHMTGTTNPEVSVGRSILDFSLHVLSARHIGATLVWFPHQPPTSFEQTHLSKPPREPGIDLNVTAQDRAEALATLLATVDGACIIESSGHITGVEAFLKQTDAAERFVKHHGGTRHNSAARFSFDVAESVVFVVSEDGPVTVFSDGMDILRLHTEHSADIQTATRLAPEIRNKQSIVVKRVACPTCAKSVIVDVERIDGWTDNEFADCPVCTMADSIKVRGYAILAVRVAKPWEPQTATATWALRL